MGKIRLRDEKGLVKSLLMLGIPISLQSLISFSINMADVFMVQMLGERELDACMIGNIPCLIFFSIVFGLGGGACILCSQYYGKKDFLSIKKVMAIALNSILLIGGLYSLILFLKAEWVMGLLTNNRALIEIGAPYLKIVSFSYVLMGFMMTYMLTIRSVGTVKISLLIEVVTLVSNVFLNYVFIFGHFNLPKMGVTGAAIATLTSRCLVFCIGIWFLQRKEDVINFRLADLLRPSKDFFVKFYKVSSGVIVSELLWGLGISFNNVIFSKAGAQEVVAAVSVMNIIMQLSTVFVTGYSAAAEIVIGRLVGKNEKDRIKLVSRALIVISVLVGLTSCGLTLIARNPIVNMGKLSLGARVLAKKLINVHAVVIVFQAVSSTCIYGVLRGGADTKTVLALDTISMWCFSIPLAWLGNYVWGLAPVMVYALTRVDAFAKLAFAILRLKGGRWMKNMTEVHTS